MNAGFLKGWLANSVFPRVLTAVLVSSPFILAACHSHAQYGTTLSGTGAAAPQEQVADFRIAPCDHLWQIDDSESMNNALYWLRAMACAGRLTPFHAREQARQVAGNGWEHVFKQGILLDNAGITQAERHQVLEQINVYRQAFPAALRPLVDTWSDRQTLFLALSDERLRYKRLQESSDKQLEALRIQQDHLQDQLEKTTRKLENLTDIERQLSSRKSMSGELPEDANERHTGANTPGADVKRSDPGGSATSSSNIPVDAESVTFPEPDKSATKKESTRP
ncbi:two-component system QseEF-associated lipoprotein QseG [Pectobacterium cacticida]|uniref:two-component system QseEF-associated lipoprotein QseG n=1 Tax=Pectobacterium cacticida TaxID=69221 RepID=UPI003988787A